MTLRRLAIIEYHLLAQRDSPADTITRHLKTDASASITDLLVEMATEEIATRKEVRVVTSDELLTWLGQQEGIVFSAWLCLEPAFRSLAACNRFLHRLTSAELLEYVRRRDMVSGFDLLSLLDWLPSDDGKKQKYAPWKRFFHSLGIECGWTPEQIGSLTLYQVRLLNASEADIGGKVKMSWAEATAATSRRKRKNDPKDDPQNWASRKEARAKQAARRTQGK